MKFYRILCVHFDRSQSATDTRDVGWMPRWWRCFARRFRTDQTRRLFTRRAAENVQRSSRKV